MHKAISDLLVCLNYFQSFFIGLTSVFISIAIVPAWIYGHELTSIIGLALYLIVAVVVSYFWYRWVSAFFNRQKVYTRVLLYLCSPPLSLCIFIAAFLFGGIPYGTGVSTILGLPLPSDYECAKWIEAPYVLYGVENMIGRNFICTGHALSPGCPPSSTHSQYNDKCDRYGFPSDSHCYYTSYEPSIFNWRRSLIVGDRNCNSYFIKSVYNGTFEGYHEEDTAGG